MAGPSVDESSLPQAREPAVVAAVLAAVICQTVLALGCAPRQVEVVAIANEGFLVSSGRHAVLVDALFRATAPYPEFFQEAPSEDLLRQMIEGDGEFARIDLALVSHLHRDHFHAPTVRAFLDNHPETTLVGTADITAALSELGGFDDIADRVLVPTRALGSCKNLEKNGVEVTACLVGHSGGREPANMIVIVDLDGFRFLHEGDADMQYAAFEGLELGERRLDLCFMHDWYAVGDGRSIVTDLLRPRALVLMHHRWARASETTQALDRLSPEVAAELPSITVFSEELENKTYGIE